MAYGLQLWDASGNPTLTVTDRLTRYYAKYTFTTAGSGTFTTYISLPGATATTWFAYTDSPFYKAEIVSGGVNIRATFYTDTTAAVYIFRS